jgi:predicted nucleotidyltransferase
MRLSETAARVIRETAARQFGAGAQVWLFGSRVRDAARGGDIDLLVVPAMPPASRARAAAEFAAALQWQLGDQRIDVVIDDGSGALPIVARARETGERLL